MPIKTCNKRCSGCAFTRGSEANREPDNNITAQLAVMGPFPFYCHENIDYSTLRPGKISRQEFHRREMMLCTGYSPTASTLSVALSKLRKFEAI